MIKRFLSFFLFIVLLASVSLSEADSFWEKHWQPGEYVVEFTPEEETQMTGIIEKANVNSEGTNIRIGADRENDPENDIQKAQHGICMQSFCI